MTEPPEKTEAATSPEKLMIDDPSDFPFHAAYTTYSEIFDKTGAPEIKRQLNENITRLKQHEIDIQTFYGNISRYRGDEAQRGYTRSFVGGQRKKDWRRKTQKQERIGRHKK
jgi:hypothetical protein